MRENMKVSPGVFNARRISGCSETRKFLFSGEILLSANVRGGGAGLRLVDGGRNESKILPERAAEMRRTRKAPRKCDVRDRFPGLGLKLLAAMQQPCPPDKIADGHALVAEQHVQIALGAA